MIGGMPPTLRLLLFAVCLFVIFTVLIESFEALILPRRVLRQTRFINLFYRDFWKTWKHLARFTLKSRRDDHYSIFGPLSVIFILITWALLLIIAFAGMHYALATPLLFSTGEKPSFFAYLYLSATTFTTLGLGDITPRNMAGRVVTNTEAGTGFGFLAIVISYLPVLYGIFSRREIEISLLDARASSPPSAGELLQRVGNSKDIDDINTLLGRWERWCAELLESHLSFPLLMYYRSQHDLQSWLGALTTMLDTSALLIACNAPNTLAHVGRARLTFAMARHAAVDLCLMIGTQKEDVDRLPHEKFVLLQEALQAANVPLVLDSQAEERLREIRLLYEGHLLSLSEWLLLPLPEWLPSVATRDNWQTSHDPASHFFRISR